MFKDGVAVAVAVVAVAMAVAVAASPWILPHVIICRTRILEVL